MADASLLRAEFTADPVAIGYGTWTSLSDDDRIQRLFNDATKRALSTVLVPAYSVVNQISPTEFASLTAVQLAQLSAVLSAGLVDLASSTVRTLLSNIFPAAPGTTRANLVALWNAQLKTRSRAAELGLGATVSDVTKARIS